MKRPSSQSVLSISSPGIAHSLTHSFAYSRPFECACVCVVFASLCLCTYIPHPYDSWVRACCAAAAAVAAVACMFQLWWDIEFSLVCAPVSPAPYLRIFIIFDYRKHIDLPTHTVVVVVDVRCSPLFDSHVGTTSFHTCMRSYLQYVLSTWSTLACWTYVYVCVFVQHWLSGHARICAVKVCFIKHAHSLTNEQDRTKKGWFGFGCDWMEKLFFIVVSVQ